jgi:hypothetical protein
MPNQHPARDAGTRALPSNARGTARRVSGSIRGLDPGLLLGLLLGLATLPITGAGCSPGETSILNPNTNRTGLAAPPETLRVPVTADREHRPLIPTGSSMILRVAKTDSVEAIAFLRFTDIPVDTSAISGARLGLLVSGGAGSGLRVAAYEVTPDSNWTWGEADDAANGISVLTLADTARIGRELNVSLNAIAPPTSDTVFVNRVVQLDGALLRRWVRLPKENDGIALRLAFGSPAGELDFLSRQGLPDSARAANPALEFMQGDSVVAVRSPAADAFLYIDRRPPVSGTLPEVTVADWPPQQAIFRFPVLDSLRRRFGSQYNRVTIQRAMLHLRAVAEPDSTMHLAAHGFTSKIWNEAVDPGVLTLVGTTDVFLVNDRLTNPLLGLRIETGATVRGWVRGEPDGGVLVRSTGELTGRTRISFRSREVADSLQPWLEVVYSRPPDPRWGVGGAK